MARFCTRPEVKQRRACPTRAEVFRSAVMADTSAHCGRYFLSRFPTLLEVVCNSGQGKM